jgi:hypothetical protein
MSELTPQRLEIGVETAEHGDRKPEDPGEQTRRWRVEKLGGDVGTLVERRAQPEVHRRVATEVFVHEDHATGRRPLDHAIPDGAATAVMVAATISSTASER